MPTFTTYAPGIAPRMLPLSTTLDEQQSPSTPTAGGGDKFQSTDTSKPTEESYEPLSQQMEPSNSEGSATISPGQNENDAQYLRKISLSVYSSGTGGNANQGLELSLLRVNWNVKQPQQGTTPFLWARIYNLAPATMAKIIAFTRVKLQAGYVHANYGLIFDGTVIQYRRGKENPTDSYIEIHASDGEYLNRTYFTGQYPVGTKDKQVILDVVKKLGANIKYIDPDVGNLPSQRDTTYAGAARDTLRELTAKYGGGFLIEHGDVVVYKNGNTRPGGNIILTPKTGLVGLPEVTPQGVQATCLLNSQIRIGGVVKLDPSVLSGVAFTPGSAVKVDANGSIQGNTGGKTQNAALWGPQLETAFTSPIGKYKVIFLEQNGDTRGDPWYSNMICVALDDQGHVITTGNPSSVFFRAAPPAVPGSVGGPGSSSGQQAVPLRRVA